MNLADIDKKDSLIYMERYVNEGSPSGFTKKNQTSHETCPFSDNEFFFLMTGNSDNAVLEEIGNFPHKLFLECLGEKSIFVHPDMVNSNLFNSIVLKKSNVRVSPTSSSRTVKLLDYPGYFKLSYNRVLGRIDRSLTFSHARASVELTNLLMRITSKNKYAKLAFFPESGARVLKLNNSEDSIGLVYRENDVAGLAAEYVKYIIPVFSLFSKDIHHMDDIPLLIQLIEMHNADAFDFVLNKIIFVIIDSYFSLLLEEGLQPEWHAQNLLIGLDRDKEPCCIIMRDLESIDIDYTLRKNNGNKDKMSFFPYKYIDDKQYNYKIKHSFMYDFKIGEYIFEPLIKLLERYYGIEKSKIINAIQEYSYKYIKALPSDFFPSDNCWYAFDNVVVDRSIDSRPYIKFINPKYRRV